MRSLATTTEMTTTNGSKALAKKGDKLKTPRNTSTRRVSCPSFAEAGSAAMDPKALVRMTLMAASREPKLLKCSRESVLRAMLDAAELGIAPSGLQGRGYVVPRENKKVTPAVQEFAFDPGWRGPVDIARRSGVIESLSAHVVYSNEEFKITYGIDERIDQTPCLLGDRGEVIGAYAIARLKGGGNQTESVTRADLDKIRNVSPAGRQGSGPWGEWADTKAKTVRASTCSMPRTRLERSIRSLKTRRFRPPISPPMRGHVRREPPINLY